MELFVSFSEIMHFFKRTRVRFLLVVLAFGVVCGLLPLKFVHFSYSANTTITLSCEIPETASTDYRQQYTNILGLRVQTAIAEAQANDLVAKTADKLGIDKGIISKISADQLKGAPVVKLTVQATDGNKAAQISDTAAQILADEITQQFPSPKLTVTITDKAVPMTGSSKKASMMKGALLGLLLGLIVYVVYGLICVLSDRSVRNGRYAEEAMKTKFLGEIPHERRGSGREDAFRKLRAAAFHQFGGAKCVLIESVGGSDGGEETAAGLAVALAQAGKKVLAVDADLREPKLAELLGVKPQRTLNDALTGSCTAAQAAAEVPDRTGLSLISGVKTEESPADLFARGFEKMVSEAETAYDYVVIYAPSELAYPDADSIAASAQAVVLAAKYGATTYVSLKDALRATGEAGGKVAGFVITDA